MTIFAAHAMAGRLTEPFAPGADSLLLILVPTADPAVAQVSPYTFTEHLARYEHQPQPAYILLARHDIRADIRVTVDYGPATPGGVPPPGSVSLPVPAGTLEGTSFVIPDVPRRADVRLLQVHATPDTPGLTAADCWHVVALLGNTARLLWVVGWERDQIRRHLAQVVAQRHLVQASGLSLDFIGSDLGVPRFPPLPYPFDSDTIALYHLDDQPQAPQPEVDTVEDLIGRYTPPGNPGTNINRLARSRIPGRFGTAFAFRDANAEIRIPALAGMAGSVNDSFTIECFIKPDPGAADGHVLAKHPDPANAGQPGWALSIGAFGRGVAANVRFLLSDGPHAVVLFADQTVTTVRFHHLAGVVDRAAGLAHLYLDGALVATQSISALGGVANGEPVRIGRAGTAAFQGLVDEVRLSQVARLSFHPVLGEDDAIYRRRLGLFRRWILPTRETLQRVLNDIVGPIGGDAQAVVVDDTDSTLIAGELDFSIVPQELRRGESISASGDRQIQEADVSGTTATEITFDPVFLQTNNDPRVTFAPPPARVLTRGEVAPDPHRMQRVTRHQLDALLDVLSGQSGLRVESAFDPRAPDLRAVGRALLLTHTTLSLGTLAALVHRAGFAFVCFRADLNMVYASSAPGDYLDLVVQPGGTATSANGVDLLSGQTLVLGVQPALPLDTIYRWVTIACGAGRGRFVVATGNTTALQPTASGATVTLQATAPGALSVKVEVTRARHTASGNRTFNVGLDGLADGGTIGADGTMGVSEAVAGVPEPDEFFHPAYLVTHDNPHADYGNDLNHRRMQPAVAAHLDRLLAFLASSPGTLQVQAGFVPGANDLTGLGRALTLSHSSVAPERLGALAHTAGFTFVRRQGSQVFIRQAADTLMTVAGSTSLDEGGDGVLVVSPQAAPSGIAVRQNALIVANAGTDTVSEIDPATGRVRRALKSGWNPVAVALSPDGTRVYTADLHGNTITAIDLTTGRVLASIPARRAPVALAHHPTQPRLYVACRDDNAVLAIDTGALVVSDTVVVGARPVGLAVRPDGAEVWVALDTSGQIAILTASPFAQAALIALPGSPATVAFLPDNSQAYVSLPAASRVVVVSVSNRTITTSQPAGTAPTAVAVAPDGSAVYVTDLSGGTQPAPQLLILNPNGSTRNAVRVPAEPVAVAADRTRVYVANRSGNILTVIDVVEAGVADTWPLGSGLGERVSWVLRLGGAAQAHLSSTTMPQVTVHADRTGAVLARAVYTLQDHNDPYTFAVRLTPALEADPQTIIRKDQYDLMMNVLNAFHPIGVEVITRAIRERVIEVRAGLLNAFPDYTYPNFRVRGPVLRRASQP
jgi:YVTN family beta-propeller protein